MEQQLQAQIKKNKNLLQSNFTLMQENELCVTALSELRKFMNKINNEQQSEEAVSPDDAQILVDSVINKIKQMESQSYYSQQEATQEKNPRVDTKRQCQCEKWKGLYTNESQQSLRLSKKIVELEMNISRMEAKHELQCKEMDSILKKYLVLFQKVNSVNFMQSEISNKRAKQTVKQNKNDNSKASKQKQKRSTSKSKPQTSRGTGKKSSKGVGDPERTQIQDSLPSNVVEEIAEFPSFVEYLQNLRKDFSHSLLENKLLREQICDVETLIRIYRQKERERILYNKFMLD